MGRPRWENLGTGVEQIHPSFDKKKYEVKKSQLKLIMDRNEKYGLHDKHTYTKTELN